MRKRKKPKRCDDTMPESIKSVTIQMINTGKAILRRYDVQYYSGINRTYGIPPNNVEKFIRENKREFSKVKYNFHDESK